MSEVQKEYLAASQKQLAEDGPSKLTKAMQARRVDFTAARPDTDPMPVRYPPDHSPYTLKDPQNAHINNYAFAFDTVAGLLDRQQKIMDASQSVKDRAAYAKQVLGEAKRIASRYAEMDKQFEAKIKHAEGEVETAIGLPVGGVSAEVRNHVAKLSRNDQISFIQRLKDAGDQFSLKALASCPPYLSGLDDITTKLVRDAAEEVCCPVPRAQREMGKQGRALLARALDHYNKEVVARLERWAAGGEGDHATKLLGALKDGGGNE